MITRKPEHYDRLVQAELDRQKQQAYWLAKHCAAHFEKLASAPDADAGAHFGAHREWHRAANHARAVGQHDEAKNHEAMAETHREKF